jgi:pre-mRNA-splicing factor RBM22/SLT11
MWKKHGSFLVSYSKHDVSYFVCNRCAFVNFKERAVAETAAQAWSHGLEIDGELIAVKWGRSKLKQPVNSAMPSVANTSTTVAS